MAVKSQQPIASATASPFTIARKPVKRRLILSIEGDRKSGKDHFALTAPGDIYLHDFDFGLDGVIQKFQDAKAIYTAEYKVNIPSGTDVQVAADTCRPVWKKFEDQFNDGIRKGRTSIVDTGTECYELLRLAEFGKLTQVMPHHYVAVNQQMKGLWRAGYNGDGNLIMLHRLKEEWVNKVVNGKEKGEKTGNMVFAGYSGTYFEAQVCTRAFKEDGQFKMLIMDCRLNPDIEGMVLGGDMCNFATLGQLVFPDSSEEDWT
jgi:hypothetical protein